MATRSGRKFHDRLSGCERDDLLLNIAQEIQNISARVASLETWRETTTINQENGSNENEDNKEPPNDNQDAESNDGGPRRRAPKPPQMNRNYAFNMAPFHENITKRVRIDVPDFAGKLDP